MREKYDSIWSKLSQKTKTEIMKIADSCKKK